MFTLAIVCNVGIILASVTSVVHGDTSSYDGAIFAALIAAMASVANTLILTRVRRVQNDVGVQVQTIKTHAEDLVSTDNIRAGQITMLRELSRDRERQIAQLAVIADRLAGHVEHLESRQERVRRGDVER